MHGHKSEIGVRIPSHGTGVLIDGALAYTETESIKWFLSILVESAALQTWAVSRECVSITHAHPRFWLTFLAITGFLGSDMEFIALDNFPVILAISNTLIHARVGLGWSQDSAVARRPRDQATTKSPGTGMCTFLLGCCIS